MTKVGELPDMSGTAVDVSRLDLPTQLQWMRPYLSDSHRETVDAAAARIRTLEGALRHCRNYVIDVKKDKSDEGRGILEIINAALEGTDH